MPGPQPDGQKWHGWGLGETSVSIAPNPEGPGIALLMTVDQESIPMAIFVDTEAAEEVMAFFDVAFSQTARANRELAALLVGDDG